MIKVYTKNKNVKQVKGVYLLKGNKICRLKVQSKIDGIIRDFISYAVPALITKDLPMQWSSKQTHVVKIDKLDKVDNIKVDNGVVIEYKKDGDNLTIVVDKGTVRNQYNSQKYSRYKTKSLTSSSNSFSSSLSESEDGYSGTLTKSGSSKVISGSYDPGQSKTASDSRTSSSDSFPSSVSYNSEGYSGTLTKSGSSSVTSGSYTPEQSRTETSTETRASNKTGTSVSQSDRPIFPIGIAYNTGGYKGTLTPVGELQQVGGVFTPCDKKTVSWSKEGDSNYDIVHSTPHSETVNGRTYSGTVNFIDRDLISGESSRYYHAEHLKKHTSGVATYLLDSYDPDTKYYSGHLISDSMPSTVSHVWTDNEGRVYTGTLHRVSICGVSGGYAYKDGKPEPTIEIRRCDTGGNPQVGGTWTREGSIDGWYEGDMYTKDTRVWKHNYSGELIAPGSDTRVWKQNYSGTVTKPAVDTRVWKQNYSGTVYKSGSDTRVWQQDYSGYIYKGGYDDYYKYKVDINCRIRKK